METTIKEEIFENLRAVSGDHLEISQDSFFTYFKVSPDGLLPLMQSLKEQLGMNYLSNLTAVDYNEEFELIYHLYAIPDNGQKIALKTRVPRDQAELSSVFSIFPTADWQEREVFDLMGIRFSQHPNLVRVLLPYDFAGHPLRKDFKKEG
jgi:NADH-quinone oxidoreductase subunit C